MSLVPIRTQEMLELFATYGEKVKEPKNGTKKKVKDDKSKHKPETVVSDSKKKSEKKASNTNKLKPAFIKPDKVKSMKKKASDKVDGAPAAKKAKPMDPVAAAVKNSQPTIFINRRVAKDFDGQTYYGTVVAYDDSEEPAFWKVDYDDGDQEDYAKKDLIKGLKLYDEFADKDPSRK
jgi:hypothetical protein